MLKFEDRLNSWKNLGDRLKKFADSGDEYPDQWSEEMARIVNRAVHHNGWFEKEQVMHAISAWANALSEKSLSLWMSRYPETAFHPESPRSVGIVMAGNVPLVGLHDLLCVSLSGHRAMIKLSSDDNQIIPHLLKGLGEAADSIQVVERLNGMEAVIATGSDNTARYFEHYFGKYPHIIRKNRKSIAVLDGSEDEATIQKLGEDVFRYFGLGCRSVSKLYLPGDFDLDRLFGAWLPFQDVVLNTKYAHNYDYHRAILLLDRKEFLENGFVVLRQHSSLSTPVSIVHYERYDSMEELKRELKTDRDRLQCVVGNINDAGLPVVPFGKTQAPALWDYADGVDTLNFLSAL